MSEKLFIELNNQFNFELESGYIYLAMSAYCKDQAMDGFAHFFFKQAEEEFEHAMKFYEFIFELQGKVEYAAIPKPKVEYKTFKEVFSTALEHEKEVTRRIKELVRLADEENDYDAHEFLQWFIAEQREEEDTFTGIVTRLERINESWNGLYIFDRELAKR